jgi:hypothetical protein
MNKETKLYASVVGYTVTCTLLGAFLSFWYMDNKHKEYVDNELKARYSTDVTKKQCVDAINLAVDSIVREENSSNSHALELLAASRNVDVRTYVLAANNVGEITGRVFVMNKFAKAYGQEEMDKIKLAQEIKESSLAYCNAIQ